MINKPFYNSSEILSITTRQDSRDSSDSQHKEHAGGGIIPILHKKVFVTLALICLVIYAEIRGSLYPRRHDMASYNLLSNSKCH